MKFAGKYELHESVTSGPVETFVAHALATNERVLVHVFECRDQKSDRPTIVRVLEAFRAIAPEPLGTVVDAGQYGDTSYVYLVTKVPKDADFERWLRHYKTDFARTEPGRLSASPQSPEIRGEFTQAFQALGEGPALDKGVTGAVGRMPGPNTESQTSVMKQTGFQGEFTKYFKGPFDGDKPAETPDILTFAESPQQRPGEFTRLFGQEKKDSPPEPTPLLNNDAQRDRSELLPSERLSNSSVFPKPPVTAESQSRRSGASFSSGIPEPVWDSGISATVNTPPTPSPSPTPTPRPTTEGGYTEVIRRADSDSAPPEEPVKAASGEKAIENKVPPPAPVPTGKSSVQLPKAPKVTVPPLGGEAAAAPPASYWPLILIWVISFFLAALVVLFFALKH